MPFFEDFDHSKVVYGITKYQDAAFEPDYQILGQLQEPRIVCQKQRKRDGDSIIDVFLPNSSILW